MSRPETLLHTNQLTVGYAGSPPHVLFTNLNLVLHQGKLICFMGPNGIGKSTLLRTLAGLHQPISGEVYYSKKNKTSPEKFLSVVLTDKPATGFLTAEELVTFGRYPYLNWLIETTPADREAIEQAMEITHITGLRNRRLFELSDGQFQLVMIARALAQATPVMLLDEPTAHLDLNNRVEMMNLLRRIAHQQQKAVLVATHELDLALQTADIIWLAGRNKDILSGIPEDLVLSGVFDEIFRFKGFDLKSGKVEHAPWRDVTVALTGEGAAKLWTMNALERNGYRVSDEAALHIRIINENDILYWDLNGRIFPNLEDLLKELTDQ
ncbi:MAG: ABC transporter ATP-binding protein [Cyclobacteriaceae bacterium]|nr:ABC transporter ATP-binding protein [Cyclobacteriaceae bacterium]